jgi:hypothetical protein
MYYDVIMQHPRLNLEYEACKLGMCFPKKNASNIIVSFNVNLFTFCEQSPFPKQFNS